MDEIFDGRVCISKECKDCCHNLQEMPLYDDEANTLRRLGTTLSACVRFFSFGIPVFAKKTKDGRKLYEMEGMCGANNGGLCILYGRPERPVVCVDTEVGGEGCANSRNAKGHAAIISVQNIHIRRR